MGKENQINKPKFVMFQGFFFSEAISEASVTSHWLGLCHIMTLACRDWEIKCFACKWGRKTERVLSRQLSVLP